MLILASLPHPVRSEQQAACHDQRTAYHIQITAQTLDPVLDSQNCEQGQCTHDHQQDHPPRRRHRGRRCAVDQVTDPPEKLLDHLPDLRPVSHKDRRQCAQMQQDVKKSRHLRSALHT